MFIRSKNIGTCLPSKPEMYSEKGLPHDKLSCGIILLKFNIENGTPELIVCHC